MAFTCQCGCRGTGTLVLSHVSAVVGARAHLPSPVTAARLSGPDRDHPGSQGLKYLLSSTFQKSDIF